MRDRSWSLLGVAAAIIGWLGWFQIAPSLGFPTVGPAAMVNRVFVPKSDPGVWLGWALVALGLVGVAAVYALATSRGWVRSGVLSGVLFGIGAWAVAGMVLMVIIGHISPPAPAPPAPPGPPLPTTPDPMHATFLMLHLGALAPIGAIMAWLLFGAVVGASSVPVAQPGAANASRSQTVMGPAPAAGLLALAVALMAGSWASSSRSAFAQAPAEAQSRVLAAGPAKVLPEGEVFFSVVELPQAPGATLGPHAHVPGFAYVSKGRETISFPGLPTVEVDAGQAGFMGALAIHSHENRNRIPAAALAIALLAIGLFISIVSVSKFGIGRLAMAVLIGALILAGAVALWNPWVNDWFFIGVRPQAARGGVMPLPNASRVYESPDLEGLSSGPYTETLRIITVPAGAQFTVDREPGAEMFLVLSGQGAIILNDDPPIPLATSDAALAQQGGSVRASTSGAGTLTLLTMSVVGSGGNP